MNPDKLFKKVADRLIAKMEGGLLPWRKAWASSNTGGRMGLFSGAAINALTGKSYSQANAFWLLCAGFTSNQWATFNQWMKVAGFIQYGSHSPLPAELVAIFDDAGYCTAPGKAGSFSRRWVWPAEVEALKGGSTMAEAQALRPLLIPKGTTSTQVIGWFPGEPYRDKDGSPKTGEDGKVLRRWNGRVNSLFNREQLGCEVPDKHATPEPEATPEPVVEAPASPEPCEVGEALLQSLKDNADLVMHLAGDRAFYTPGLDRINVPELALFVEKVGTDAAQDHFYATALHEVTHWTGAEHRLSREGITKFGGFGSKSYAFEELVAELGAAMLCQFTGIVQGEQLDENHAAYLKSWCEALKDDPRAMERATKLAIESATWTLTQAGMMDGAKDEEPAPEPTPEPKAKPTPKPKAKPKAPRKTRKPKAKPEPAPVVVAPIPEPGGQFTLF